MSTKKTLFLTLILLAFLQCRQTADAPKRPSPPPADGREATLEARDPLLRMVPAAESGLSFANLIHEDLSNNLITNVNIYNGGGVAVADFNNDGLPDLYFVASNGQNSLYVNEGNLKFGDRTAGAGVAAGTGFKTAATAVDINADGWMDLYVCRAGTNIPPDDRRNLLFINNRDLTFTESAKAYGLDDPSLSVGANFFDYDLDGDLDLYLLNTPTSQQYINKIQAELDPATGRYKPELKPAAELDTDRLYRNTGKGRFEDVSRKAGIWNLGYSQSVSVSDFNLDGWPDVYVANDYIQPDFLYINNRNGTFTERLAEYFGHTAQHTMGTDLADFDNDGWIDLFSLDMAPVKHFRRKTTTNTNSQIRYNTLTQYGYFEPVVRNVLQRNNGNGTFSETGCLAGVYKTDWSWGCLFFDVDNDGKKDLAITNGFRREVTDSDFMTYVYPHLDSISKVNPFKQLDDILKYIPVYKVRNFLYRNKGDWTFEDMSGTWATVPPTWSNGTVYADLDADGDLDWVVNNLEEPVILYENLAAGRPEANYLQFKLEGSASNPMAVGARIEIQCGGEKQVQELYPSRGIFSSVEHLVHFGTGKNKTVDRVEIRWPDGKWTVLTQVPANQRLLPRHAEAANTAPVKQEELAWFEPFEGSGVQFEHRENTYDDFDVSFLQPWRLSELGPALASADINNDGLDDFFIGNAFNSRSALYQQLPDGSFTPVASPVWESEQPYEDQGALFLDADGDGDQDLLLLGGGYDANVDLAWQPRLFLNNGSGNLSRVAQEALPKLTHPATSAVAADYDGDGDLDLLIGGRLIPQRYPLAPSSAVWRNDRGRYIDVTAAVAGDFAQCGMVTGLRWADLDGDGKAELIAVGEWMPVTVFQLKNGKLKNATEKFGLQRTNGFWNSLAVADLDGDGDPDLVAGNLGLNTSMTAGADTPFRCFAKDFDGNGSVDPILAYYEDGFLYPYRHRDVLIKQIPVLRKKFNHYREYGLAIMEDVFPATTLDSALNLYAYTLHTTWWENRDGKFVVHPFSNPAQVAPVQSIAIDDYNRDGHADILLVGNKYGVEVETGRCDAGTGCLYTGDGKGGFTWVPNTLSGLWAQKDARAVCSLRAPGGGTTVVVGNNNGRAEIYRKRSAPNPVQ